MPEATPRRRRRLAAILMADVVGFSKMMGRDEERTIELVLEFHDTVREGIERHGGRIVGTAGDSVFGDFDSIVEAMELAIEMQRALNERNAALPVEDHIVARVGLHLGDVVVEGDDVFGDGVNIASRLEQLARPGGVAVSEAVFHQVRGHFELPFEDDGLHDLKNIDQPVHVYQIAPHVLGGTKTTSRTSLVERDVEITREQRKDLIRRAIGSIADEVRTEIEASRSEGRPAEVDKIALGSGSAPTGGPTVAAVHMPFTLVMATIGVFALLAPSTGWSDNAVYPALGAALLGAALGRLLEGVSGRVGVAALFRVLGFAVGAGFLGNAVVRVLIWAGSVGLLVGALQSLRSSGNR